MFFLVVCSNLMYWYTLGFPAVLLLPALWVGSIAAEMFLQICFPGRKHKRRLLTYLSLAMCLLCEVLIWVLQANMLALAEAFSSATTWRQLCCWAALWVRWASS